MKKKGLNCQETSKVEGYICEFRKTWGVSVKLPGPAGFDLIDQVGLI
jgi:hypothetical protein